MSQSPFWRTGKSIWEKLTSQTRKDWINYIAWSNIYKIAPKTKGNPSAKLCKTQIKLCRKILQKEIETYRPTHILLVTGYNWWFQDYRNIVGVAEIFSKKNYLGSNSKDNHQYVEATANYMLSDSTTIPVVVTCRPEGKREKEFVLQTVEHFRKSIQW